MRVQLKSPLAAAITAVVLAGILSFAQLAHAATPPYEPDGNARGTLTFYDASGNVITGGNINDSPMAAYVKTSGNPRTADTVATLFAAVPEPGANSATWASTQMSGGNTYPVAGAPGPLAGARGVEQGAGGDASVANIQTALPHAAGDTGTAYDHLYAIRIITSGTSSGTDPLYWQSDIVISGTTWTQVYPVPVTKTNTTTTLSVSPPSPQSSGTSVQLTATVTPSNVTGTVQFKDGSANIGSPVTVSGGIAKTSTSALTPGSHSLTAVFTPTDTTHFNGSTSNTAPYTIKAPAQNTTTSLTVSPPSPQVAGTTVNLTATVTPSNVTGTVQFKDGSASVGSPVAVSGGVAKTATSALSTGSHSLTAVLTPTDTSAFNGSTSTTVPYTIKAPAQNTTTSLTVSPPSPQVAGTTVHLTATVTPSTVTGTVQFKDGSSNIGGPMAVAGGVASTSTNALSTGSHNLSAVLTPTDPTAFNGSTATAVPYTITSPAQNTATTLTVSPPSPQVAGTTVHLTATVTPAAAGKVQFKDGSTSIGGPVTVSGGVATGSTSTLSGGSHNLTAVFTPTDPTAFNGSTSNTVPYTITSAAQNTTTNLTVSPSSPQVAGTTVHLTATVTPGNVTGTVQFMDGTTNIGSPVTVSGGIAKTSTSSLSVGPHNLSAVLTPTDPTAFNGSTSNTVPYTITSAAQNTTTTLAVAPPSPEPLGTTVHLTATVTPAAAGTVQFKDGVANIGSPVGVSGGVATTSTSALGAGSHSLTAVFAPTDPTAFNGSTSSTVPYTITSSAQNTTTALTVSPPSPQVSGTTVHLTATVTPAAPGTVQFKDGSASIGSAVTVSGGVATTSTTTLSVGSHNLSAVFTPTDPTAFNGSTSSTVPYTITTTAKNTTTALTVSPASPQVSGTTVHLTATVTPAAAGKVQFKDGSTSIGSAVTVSGGVATTSTSTLSAGSHNLSAVFTPTDPTAFNGSTSNTVPYTITTTKRGNLKISTHHLHKGRVQRDYSDGLLARGGSGPYLWSVLTGALPDGLSLDGATGMITGSPTQAGDFTFTMGVTDSTQPVALSVSKTFKIHISHRRHHRHAWLLFLW
jgi:hypothetical protein